MPTTDTTADAASGATDATVVDPASTSTSAP
jgi:hypothetical protein